MNPPLSFRNATRLISCADSQRLRQIKLNRVGFHGGGSLRHRQMFLALEDFRARFFLLSAIVRPKFLQVVIELFGNLAAYRPDFFQRFVTFRFHRLSPAIPAALPTAEFPNRARRSHAEYGRPCLRWPNACNSTSPKYRND